MANTISVILSPARPHTHIMKGAQKLTYLRKHSGTGVRYLAGLPQMRGLGISKSPSAPSSSRKEDKFVYHWDTQGTRTKCFPTTTAQKPRTRTCGQVDPSRTLSSPPILQCEASCVALLRMLKGLVWATSKPATEAPVSHMTALRSGRASLIIPLH